MSIPILSGRVFLVVTGASKGIGKEIAEKLATFLSAGSRVLLLARNAAQLEENAKKLPPSLKVDFFGVDLASADQTHLEGLLLKSLGGESPLAFDRAVVIHNAGSLGNIDQLVNEMTDFDVWRKYFDLNVFSPAVLNGVFMKLFSDSKIKKVVINITSLLAIQPAKSSGYYCTGKAAREMFFKVFALENPDVNVLNYSPGPVETDMYQRLVTESRVDEIKEQFRNLKKDNILLTTQQTVSRFIEILKEQKYKPADHVDYFDQENFTRK